MDQKRPDGKTYSEVMNEWASQRNFVQESRSRLLHPPYDASPGMKVLGYLFRLMAAALVPLIAYVFLLNAYTSGPDFNKQLGAGVCEALQAGTAEPRASSWSFDGMLIMRGLKAKGRREAFFEQMDAENISTRVPIPMIFQKQWTLGRVSVGELDLILRAGGLGSVPAAAATTSKTGAVQAPEQNSGVLRAGYGIAPDFAALRINALQAGRLKAAWGKAPATVGGVSEMQTDATRTATGWTIAGKGGSLRQSWLDGLDIEKLALTLTPGLAQIDEARFNFAGNGKATLTGSMTMGELPILNAELKLESFPVQSLVAAGVTDLFMALGTGTVKLSGSVNRTSGIQMDGNLQLTSGRLTGLPLLKMLHQLTGEDAFRQLPVRSGQIEFTTSGSPEHGGLVIDVTKLEVDCGPSARIKATYRQEQIFEAGDIDGKERSERMLFTGIIRLGVPTSLTAKLKPAVVKQFFTPDEDANWSWLSVPVDGPISAAFTRELAEALLAANTGAP